MTSVLVRSRDNYQQEIIAGDHYLYADEPLHIGGDDTAPDPYSLLLAALGACTSITVRMYAKRKNWDLREVEIELTHGSDYTTDCENCADKAVKLEKVTMALNFQGNLDGEQRQRLFEIAKRCPVHQTLIGDIRVSHRLTDEDSP